MTARRATDQFSNWLKVYESKVLDVPLRTSRCNLVEHLPSWISPELISMYKFIFSLQCFAIFGLGRGYEHQCSFRMQSN